MHRATDGDRLPETTNWVRMTGVSRRAALAGGAAVAGYALAARPVMAAAIATPVAGLDAGMVRFPADQGFAMNGYRARPAGKTDLPVIIVVQEIFGLHEWVRDIVRRLAHAGYYAIAPDYYQRLGDPTKIADIDTLFRTMVARVPDAQVLADSDAAARFAASEGADAGRLGITGFCWGGRIVWLTAAHNPHLKAGVAFYGQLANSPTELQPTRALDLAGKLHAPVLGLYGERDRGIPVADVEAMRAALQAANSPGRVEIFAGADHGFMADYRPSYDEAAAKKAWADALGWFAKLL